MRRFATVIAALAVGCVLGVFIANRSINAHAATKPGLGFAAVPGVVGGQDTWGPYELVNDWPKDISTLPGHEKWTWGAAQSVYAENPNRIYLLVRGELPKIPRPAAKLVPEFGPSLQFPIGRLPMRDATVSSLPGSGGADGDATKGWKGTLGVDARWEHCLTVVDGKGNILETWTQWDKIFRRPHYVTINPYDPEKHIWVIDDNMHAIYKFTHDGKQLVQTIGTPNVAGADGTHFSRPTFMAWLPDSTMFVADGYTGTRVAKFDKDGKFLMDWGKKGTPPNETRPGYMNHVHGVAVDPQTRRVFVEDGDNRRLQVFDENGKYLYEWSFGPGPSSIHFIYIGADRNLWAYDHNTYKMLKYDLEGHFLYSFGTFGDFPGGFWGVHGMSVDQESNLYLSDVDTGMIQKFRPRKGANPDFVVSKPIYSAWK